MSVEPQRMFRLTHEERARVTSVLGLVEQVAREVWRVYGPFLPYEELVRLGHLGVIYATLTFDPTRGVRFATWARIRAMGMMLDGGRKEKKPRLLRALAYLAMLSLGREQGLYDQEAASAADDLAESIADNAEQHFIVGMLMEDARPREEEVPDNALIAEEAWTKTHAALERVLGELRAEHRSLIEEIFVMEETVKTSAKSSAVDYGTLLDRYNALIKRMRARMVALGIKGSPARLERPWNLLGEAARAKKDGEKNDGEKNDGEKRGSS
jgi:DNA-directed RNA polymerase specialized sigma subunit